jgi:uncharacterized FlaG/YvyC family protein
MQVTRIDPAMTPTAISPASSVVGKAEERNRGASRADISTETVKRGTRHLVDLGLGGTKQPSPFEHTSSERDVKAALQRANEALETFDHVSLRLSYDHERRMVIMQVVRTGEKEGDQEEVIRQIPQEDLLQLVDRLAELQGVLFDRQV